MYYLLPVELLREVADLFGLEALELLDDLTELPRLLLEFTFCGALLALTLVFVLLALLVCTALLFEVFDLLAVLGAAFV